MADFDLKSADDRMPHDIEAERAVIGCLLQNNDTIEEVFATVTADMFYNGPLRAIFSSIGDLSRAGTDVDKITVRDRILSKLSGSMQDKVNNIKQRAKELEGYDEKTLNDQFFIDLLENAAIYTNVISYCNIIKNKYLLRQAIETASKIISDCRSGEKNAIEISTEAQDEYFKIGMSDNKKAYSRISDFIKPIFADIEKAASTSNGITGLETGYKQLDNITAGFQNSDMIVLAARPGMGKTTFALNLAYNICSLQNKSVLFFSLEMGGIQLAKRVLSSLSFVSSHKIRTGKLSDADMRSIIDSSLELDNKKFFIRDSSLLTIADLRNECMKVKTKEGLDIVFIDYLQLMVPGDNYKNANKNGFMSRQEEVSAISRNIKALAKDLDIPIIAMSQLHREAENRSGPPQLSDLRESGAIEQDADIVMLIHRPDKDDPQKVDIILAKHRNGSTGTVNLRFDKETTRFSEWDNKTNVPSNVN